MQISIQLVELVEFVDTFELPFLKQTCLAASPAPADLHGGPTTAASAWPGPAYTETSVIGSEDGDIVLGERLDIAAAIARDDPGSSEHGGCQESKNRDLHGSDRPIGSRSVMAVGTRTGTVPYWRMRWMDDDKHRLHSERFV